MTIALGEPFAEPPDPLLSAVAQFRSLLVEHLSGLVDAACCWLVDACNWVEDRWESVARRLGRFGRRWAVVNAVDQPGAGNQVWAWCATRREAVELAGRFERHEIGFGFYTLPEGGLTVRRWP